MSRPSTFLARLRRQDVDARHKAGHDEPRVDRRRAIPNSRFSFQTTEAVIARSESDEAIHLSLRDDMDCFAEPVISARALLRSSGARIRATRWLAMRQGDGFRYGLISSTA
ncbi:MAG TPA: hypothetical protein VNY06_06865 [Methylocella sp.]|nr:hypothetical protein [Methylocella sp.]